MKIETWFPTLVAYEDVSEDTKQKILNEFLNIEPLLKNKVLLECWGDNVNATFTSIENLIEEFNLNEIKNAIFLAADQFNPYLNSKPKKLKLTFSWINYYNKYQYQERHDHVPGYISGVYYLKTNGKDGNLRIHKPNQLMQHGQVEYAPKEGRLILFPSWLEHSVRPNMTNDTRISVSFNLEPM
jgi:uncharacterized protein (TIGR02466 family)